MADILTVADLERAKQDDTFHAEVITGKLGGNGADIDFATHARTGQTQTTLPKVLSNVGFSPAGFDFTTGGTLTERDKAIFYQTDGNWYSWGGTLPKVVPPASSPASTGGIADNAWNVSTSAFMYRDWEGFTAELLAQAGIVDDGLPDELGASQRVEAIKALISLDVDSIDYIKTKNVKTERVRVKNLQYKSIKSHISPPLFIRTSTVEVSNASQTDGFTYFYDATGALYEREIEFDPRGNNVMCYTEHWGLEDMNFIFDAMDCGIRGFYFYVNNGVYGQTDSRTKQVVDLLLKYNFSIVIGMSCPEVGYQDVVDFWADRFNQQNVVGIGFCDEPEFHPTQTVAWQQAVISYIRTKSRKAIYTASVGTSGSGRSAVADEVDFVLWDYYRQNITVPDLNVYAYDLSQLESLGKRPGRAIPVIGVYKESTSTIATSAQVQKWNQALIDMRPASEDLWAFVFYTRPSLNFENLITTEDYRSILSACVQYKKGKASGGFEYATLGMIGVGSYNVASSTTALMNPSKTNFLLSNANAIYFKLREPAELCRYAFTVQDISGGPTSKVSTFLIQAFSNGEWITVKSFTHAAQEGNPSFKSGSIGLDAWIAPIGIKSADYRFVSTDTYATPFYQIRLSTLIFGNPTV